MKFFYRNSFVEVPALSPPWLCYLAFNTWLLVSVLIMGATGLQLIISVVTKWLERRKKPAHQTSIPMERMSTTDVEIPPSFADTIKCNLLNIKSSSSPTEGREYCQRVYEDIKEHYFQGCQKRTDFYFFKILETSNLSNYFYGHVDHDLGSKFESWYKGTFPTILKFLDRPKVFKRLCVSTGIFNTIIYYLVNHKHVNNCFFGQ